MAFKLTVTTSGVTRTVRNLGRLGPDTFNAAAKALDEEMELIMRESRDFYVPVNDGVLRSTIRKGRLRKTRKSAEVRVGAGFGGAESYALAVHEHPSAHSPRTWQGKGATAIRSVRSGAPWGLGAFQRGPKYLSRPLNRAIANGRFLNRISTAISRAIRKLKP